jgi:hypothetical protein
MLWIRVLSPRWILGRVLGPDASSSLGVDQISRLPGGDIFDGHGCYYGYMY